ncbi:MAG: hypothetical protein OXU51_07775 [Candidatus Poribacteria bacterium]|nr:hypothetical protein [Candidatus Poribacteria bacterium]
MIEVYKVSGDIKNAELVELFETEDIEKAKAFAEKAFKETGDEHFFDVPKDAPVLHADMGIRYVASDIPF